MKRCPQCNRVENDNTLTYCRSDGTVLIGDSASVNSSARNLHFDSGGVANEIETSLLPHRTDADLNRPTAETTFLPVQTKPVTTRELKRSRSIRTVALVIGGLFLIAVLSVASYLYLTREQSKAIESIAVMPFINEGGNADVEYLSDGMTETLISSLSQIPNLNVKARSSVFRYKGKEPSLQTIKKDLNVQAILNGRVSQRGDQLTLNLELVDAKTENVLWSERYNRKESDLVSLQTDIARDVSSKLKTRLSGAVEQKLTKSYTANPQAYQLYLKGRFYWNQRNGASLKKSAEYFSQAIDRDPSYALAHASLAYAYALIPGYHAGTTQDYLPRAKAAATKALELDDSLPEAHSALALILWGYDWKFVESTKELERALELNPNDPTAHHWRGENLVNLGSFEEGIAELKRAQELDPLSIIINADLGEVLIYARRYDEAIEQLRKTVEMDKSFYYAQWHLGMAYQLKGSYPEAIAAYQKARLLDDDPLVLALLASVNVAFGKRDEALKLLEKLKAIDGQQYVTPYAFVVVYAALGDKDQAFQWLEKGYQDRSSDLAHLKVDPLVDNLRPDPRFADMVRRVGLP